MTPRALLSAIGATALAFAVAIGVAADSTSVETVPIWAADAAVQAVSAPLPASTGDADARLAAWNDPCVIAV